MALGIAPLMSLEVPVTTHVPIEYNKGIFDRYDPLDHDCLGAAQYAVRNIYPAKDFYQFEYHEGSGNRSARMHFKCNKNFYIHMCNKTRTANIYCLGNGTFSGTAPKCKVKESLGKLRLMALIISLTSFIPIAWLLVDFHNFRRERKKKREVNFKPFAERVRVSPGRANVGRKTLQFIIEQANQDRGLMSNVDLTFNEEEDIATSNTMKQARGHVLPPKAAESKKFSHPLMYFLRNKIVMEDNN